MRITRKVFHDLAIWQIGFGLCIGLVFPPFVMLLGVPRATALVRRIRDEQAKLLQGKSDEQIIELFRKAGDAARRRARARPRSAAAHQRVLLEPDRCHA